MDIFNIMMHDLRVQRSGEIIDFSLPTKEEALKDDQIENEVNEMLEERAGLEELAHDDFLDK